MEIDFIKLKQIFDFLKNDQIDQLKEIIKELSTVQIAWISGYLYSIAEKQKNTCNTKKFINNDEPVKVTLISASQTGNARSIAKDIYKKFLKENINVQLFNSNEYNFKKIDKEKILLIIISTYGEGEPPEEAISFYNFLMSKNAPTIKNCFFSIFGLGDTSYQFFNQAGKDLDKRLEELKGKRIIDRVDADIEYLNLFENWSSKIISFIKKKMSEILLHNKKKYLKNSYIIKKEEKKFSKDNPFNAKLIMNKKITGRYSKKDVRHLEISLGDSTLKYSPGDSLGIWYKNDENLVYEFLDIFNLQATDLIKFNEKNLTIFKILKNYCEITVNTINIVKKYASLSNNIFLKNLLKNEKKLQRYVKDITIIDMFKEFPTSLQKEQLISIFRPITPRFYSISSSQKEFENEIHITVNVLSYKIKNKIRMGGASSYLAYRLKTNKNLRIFIEKNNNFRLPSDAKIPVIMIAAGTGIAPFRAFMQERNQSNEKITKNWLFFGNQTFSEDFLYQTEWQYFFRKKTLTYIDLAWSRDDKKKIYVQDKLYQKKEKIWSWILKGAHLYVCGNAKFMAKEVNNTLLKIFMESGKMNSEQSHIFLNKLRMNNRYQRDIY
ncbi:assimilatory sulfite reductase (NADPH) flavoprotein subunit [Candidatus Tachikawaea gelatinosa]|uniref:Sulfite reductase [NADPH] flavoprotein alpha-component n=1 Tax=Candidatus Tachikawaea gelatinosa TaxID=1410383 RepID=A0A090ALM0_9ENTR|nr:assimilatory sulfite reductase (NADPH) flavoprotein subunit [Candidatus Tachikawaea gelatinosa]BAP58544.1 sulfite reductase [NADPH] flavoprotein alpha-component [Candidatus Tachikawaea gelatinosa]